MIKFKKFFIFLLFFCFCFFLEKDIYCVSDDIMQVYNSCEKTDFPSYKEGYVRNTKYDNYRLPDLSKVTQIDDIVNFINSYYTYLKNYDRVISDPMQYHFVFYFEQCNTNLNRIEIAFYLFPKDIDFSKCTLIKKDNGTYYFKISDMDKLVNSTYYLSFFYYYDGSNKDKGGFDVDTAFHKSSDFGGYYLSFNPERIYMSNITFSTEDGDLIYSDEDLFYVQFNTNGSGHLSFCPRLSYNKNKYTIKCKIDDVTNLNIYFEDDSSNDLSSEFQNCIDLVSDNWYRIYNNTSNMRIFELSFSLINNETGVEDYSCSFTCQIVNSQTVKFLSGKENNKNSDEFNEKYDIGDDSSNVDNNFFNSINEDMSFDDLINFAKGSLNTFSSIFSIVPSFIWLLVAVGITICIILRILGR